MNIQIQDSSKIQGYLLNRVMIYDILYISKNDSEFHYWRIEDRIRIRSGGSDPDPETHGWTSPCIEVNEGSADHVPSSVANW